MPRPQFLLVIIDAVIAAGGFYLAGVVRFRGGSMDLFSPVAVIFCVLVIVVLSYLFGLYDLRKIVARRYVLLHSGLVTLIALLVLSALFYAFPSLQLGRGVLLLFLLLTFLGQGGLRFAIGQMAGQAQFANRIFIIGTGPVAQTIGQLVPPERNMHSFLRYIRCTDKQPLVAAELIAGHIDDIDELIKDYRPQKLIVALTERRGSLPLRELMNYKLRGIEIIDAVDYFERMNESLWIERMQPSAFVYSHGFRMTSLMRAYKRINDIAFSALGLLCAAPLFPVLALLIKLDSAGPIIYKQLRVGENEVEYFIYKFRTMAADAEKSTGAVWAQKDDPRVTRIGALMRKTRLDEIPQLYNVLKGDMSFVGPRPERMAFVERLKEVIPFYSTRHFVKPGVTGWAQIRYPYGATDEDALEKLRYDLYYIKNYSILLDLRIIFDTVRVVLTGFGGR